LKKFSAIILGVLFVLSMAASAFAIHAEIPAETQATVAKGTTQITLGGLLRTRGWYFDNVDASTALPREHKDRAFYDQRVQLLVEAKVSPNVTGLFQLQGDQVWGDTGFNQKGDSLRWIQAWIQYTGSGLLGIPAGLKIGHMPLALGNQTFFQHTTNGDDAVVVFMDPMKELHVGLLAVKLSEGASSVPATCLNPLTGTIVAPVNNACPAGTTPFTTRTVGGASDNTDDIDGYVGLAVYKLDASNTVGANYTMLNSSDLDLRLHNIGLHANGNIAGFGYDAEGNLQFGHIFTGPQTKFRGYGVKVGVNYALNPVVLRASIGYGSGDSNPTDKKNSEFQTFLSDVEHYTIAYDYRVRTAAAGQIAPPNSAGTLTGLANTTYYNLGVDYAITPSIKTAVNGFILRASKTPAGQSKNIGWEVDAKVAYNVAKNLNYIFDLGFLDAGKFYDGVNPTSSIKKNATVVRQQLILSF
jgi:hypothetical protein